MQSLSQGEGSGGVEVEGARTVDQSAKKRAQKVQIVEKLGVGVRREILRS